MNLLKFSVFSLILLFLSNVPSYAIIKIDDDSVDLAIKYGLKMKGNSVDYIMGPNWINDGKGRILNVYSPFIQLVMKSQTQGSTLDINEDVKNIKLRLQRDITKIKEKDEIRFIVSIYGDKDDFAQKYKAYIIDANMISSPSNPNNNIKPKKTSNQKIAEHDGYDPKHPYSAINCYIFKFDDLANLKEYYFVLVSDSGDEIKYKINNAEIF